MPPKPDTTAAPAVTWVPIGQVKPNPENPRTIRDERFHKLVQSIKDFPEMLALRPIVTDGARVVLGGNMRLKACKAAGLETVPIVVAEHLSDAQRREFVIKDNVGFGDWDWSHLANTWDADDLTAWGLDVPTFDVETLDEMPALPDGEKSGFETMTFTLSNDQADLVREAMEAAKHAGPFVDTGNTNGNGNALARVAEFALHGLR